MKKIIFILLILLLPFSFAVDEFKPIGISKYAVVETVDNFVPMILKNNQTSFLPQGAVLFATGENDKFYKIELKEDEYALINKNLAEIQAVIPEKRFEAVKKITFSEDKKVHLVNIKTSQKSGFKIIENGKNLEFTLYDSHFDPFETKISKKDKCFSYLNNFTNEFKFDYSSNKPLFGYRVISYDEGYILFIKKAPKINKKHPLKKIKIYLKGDDKLALKSFKKALKKKGAKVYLKEKDPDIIFNLTTQDALYYGFDMELKLAQSIAKELGISAQKSYNDILKNSNVITIELNNNSDFKKTVLGIENWLKSF